MGSSSFFVTLTTGGVQDLSIKTLNGLRLRVLLRTKGYRSQLPSWCNTGILGSTQHIMEYSWAKKVEDWQA